MALEQLSACILCESEHIVRSDPEYGVCRCSACGLTFENPRPDAPSIFAFYSKAVQYDGWLAELGPRERLWKRRLAKLRLHRRPGSLLDIGAGIGQFLAQARGEYSEVAGTEVSESAIRIAKERYGLELLQGQAEELDFGGRRFDNISLFHVLEHVGNPRRLLAKCRELLAPQGVLFIAVPNDIASIGAVKRRLLARLAPGPGRGSKVTGLPRLSLEGGMDEIHLSHFRPGVLTRFLAGNGFKVLDCSLDPFYAAAGLRLARMELLYRLFSALHAATGVNLYGTVWVAARRT
jgi:SAM-dependent methyltransferase